MSIKLVISQRVKFNVRGTFRNEVGYDDPFDFSLTCRRLDTDAMQTKLRERGDASITEFMLDVIEDWSGVKDGDDKPLPWSEDGWREMCRIRPGAAMLAYRTYLTEAGVKEKN
jgi:hypothetical protein